MRLAVTRAQSATRLQSRYFAAGVHGDLSEAGAETSRDGVVGEYGGTNQGFEAAKKELSTKGVTRSPNSSKNASEPEPDNAGWTATQGESNRSAQYLHKPSNRSGGSDKQHASLSGGATPLVMSVPEARDVCPPDLYGSKDHPSQAFRLNPELAETGKYLVLKFHSFNFYRSVKQGHTILC